MCQFFFNTKISFYTLTAKKLNNIMTLNEEEMYNAHPWLLTVPKVGISFYLPHSQTFSRKFLASFGRKAYLCNREK